MFNYKLKYRPNISTMNALIRITCGLSMLSLLTAKMVRKPWKQSYMLLAILSAMKVAEGIVRYCPMVAMLNKGQDMYEDLYENMVDDMNHFESHEEDPKTGDSTAINPS